MAEFQGGDVLGRLQIDVSQWIRGLRDAQQQAEQFQQRFRAVSLPDLRINTSAWQSSLQQVEQLYSQFANRLVSQHQQLLQRLGPLPGWMQQSGIVLSGTQSASPLPSAPPSPAIPEVQQSTATFTAWTASLTKTSLALAGVYSGMQATRAAISGLVGSATEFQRLDAAFTSITGTSAGAQRSLDFLRRTADQFGFSFLTLAQGFKGFEAASQGTNIAGAETQRIFTAIVTASRALQLSQSDLQGVLLAVQQMMSKGVISQEELRQQLGERLPGATQIAARAFGVTTQELSRMVEAGIPAGTFLSRFATQLQREFGQSATTTRTLSESVARLGNAFTEIGGTLNSSGVLTFLGGVLDKLTEIITAGPKAAKALEALGAIQATPFLQGLERQGLTVTQPERGRLIEAEARLQRLQDEANEIRRARENAFTQTPGESPLAIAQRFAETRGRSGLLGRGFEAELEANRRLQEQARTDLQRLQEEITQAARRRPFETGSIMRDTWAADTRQMGEDAKRLRVEIDTQVSAINRQLATLGQVGNLPGADRAEALQKQAEALKTAREKLEATIAQYQSLRPALSPSGQPAPGLMNVLQGIPQGRVDAALPLMREIGPRFGIDPNLLLAIGVQESRLNPVEQSEAGAQGIMQLMPANQQRLGVTDPYNLAQNITGAARLLAELFAKFPNDVAKVLTEYFAGPNPAMQGPKTRQYVQEVGDRYRALQGTQATGIPELDTALAAIATVRQRERELAVEVQAQPGLAANREAALGAIQRIIGGLIDEQHQLRLTTEELDLYTLAQAKATDATVATAQALQDENAVLRAEQGVREARRRTESSARDFFAQISQEQSALAAQLPENNLALQHPELGQRLGVNVATEQGRSIAGFRAQAAARLIPQILAQPEDQQEQAIQAARRLLDLQEQLYGGQATQELQNQTAVLKARLATMKESLDAQQQEAIVQQQLNRLQELGIPVDAATEERVRQWAGGIVQLGHALEGARRPLQEFGEKYESTFVKIQEVTLEALQKTESALVDFFSTGKFDFAGLMQGILRDLQTTVTRALFTKPLASALDSLFQSTGAGEAVKGALGGIQSFGQGGMVTRPTVALVGERGPEMIVPMALGGAAGISTRSLGGAAGFALGGSLAQLLSAQDLSAEQQAYEQQFAAMTDPNTGHIYIHGVDASSSINWPSRAPGAAGYVRAPSLDVLRQVGRQVLGLVGSLAGAYAGSRIGGALEGPGTLQGSSGPGVYRGEWAAMGNRFDKATLALIGEAGPEAVIPLRSGGIPSSLDQQGRLVAHLPSGLDIPILNMPRMAQGALVGGEILPAAGWTAAMGGWSGEGRSTGAGYNGPMVVMHVTTPDVGSFRASEGQMTSRIAQQLRRSLARNG